MPFFKSKSPPADEQANNAAATADGPDATAAPPAPAELTLNMKEDKGSKSKMKEVAKKEAELTMTAATELGQETADAIKEGAFKPWEGMDRKEIAKDLIVGGGCFRHFYTDAEVSDILPDPVPGVQIKAPDSFPAADQVLLGYQMYRKYALNLCCGQRLDVSSCTMHGDTVCTPMGWMCFSCPMACGGPFPPSQRPVYGSPEEREELERKWPKRSGSKAPTVATYIPPHQFGMTK